MPWYQVSTQRYRNKNSLLAQDSVIVQAKSQEEAAVKGKKLIAESFPEGYVADRHPTASYWPSMSVVACEALPVLKPGDKSVKDLIETLDQNVDISVLQEEVADLKKKQGQLQSQVAFRDVTIKALEEKIRMNEEDYIKERVDLEAVYEAAIPAIQTPWHLFTELSPAGEAARTRMEDLVSAMHQAGSEDPRLYDDGNYFDDDSEEEEQAEDSEDYVMIEGQQVALGNILTIDVSADSPLPDIDVNFVVPPGSGGGSNYGAVDETSAVDVILHAYDTAHPGVALPPEAERVFRANQIASNMSSEKVTPSLEVLNQLITHRDSFGRAISDYHGQTYLEVTPGVWAAIPES